MDLPCRRKAETIGRLANLFFYGEWAVVLGGEFFRGLLCGKVSGLEPDLVSDLIWSGRFSFSVIGFSHIVCCMF